MPLDQGIHIQFNSVGAMIADRQETVVVCDDVGEGGGHGTIKHRSNLNSKHPNKAAIKAAIFFLQLFSGTLLP